MLIQTSSHRLRQAGFSLVEIMVALVIGMIVSLVITEVLGAYEGRKRTTSGVADAQTNGSLALYSLQREAQLAGFGLPVINLDSPFLCGGATASAASIALSPVTITAGSAGGTVAERSDSITVRYGSSPFGGIPLLAVAGTSGKVAKVGTTVPCLVGDDVLVINGAACSLTQVAAITPADLTITLGSDSNLVAGAGVSCLGAWHQVTFGVNGDLQMQRVDVSGGGAVVVGSDVVMVKAQYGISNAVDNNQVARWVDATAASGWNVPTNEKRNRIKAIRVAVVARNGVWEKEVVTDACSSTTDDNPKGLCAWVGSDDSPAPTIDLRDDTGASFAADTPWRHYRYRVFETIIPLRNVIWSKENLK